MQVKKWGSPYLMRVLTLLIITIFATPAVHAQTNQIPTATQPTILQVVEQTLVVDGKKSQVFNIVQRNGAIGYIGKKGQLFNVIVENKTTVPTVIHWHGLILPNSQDGVPYVTQLPIPPGGSYHYNFLLTQAGTFWMHSHYQLQEQKLMAAPLIIKDPNDPYSNAQDVIMMLQDFSFKNPEQLFQDLQKQLPTTSGSGLKLTKPMQNNAMNSSMGSMNMSSGSQDLNDVNYDAMLTNRRTLNNPQVISVTPGQLVRLRIINAASGSEFWIYTGQLQGTAIAIDGEPTKPYPNKQFQLAIGQRIDILVSIPKQGGAFPILAQSQGTSMQTGLILKTPNSQIPALSPIARNIAPAIDDSQEFQFKALQPLAVKPVDQTLRYSLEGDMEKYIWTINGQVWPKVTPYVIKQGERVAMVFTNKTGMAHPMHLHGHVFEIVDIDGKPIQGGALHDTLYILPHSTMTVVFDANNPGIWMMHCHVLYHQAGGMMTTINYANYPKPSYYLNYIDNN